MLSVLTARDVTTLFQPVRLAWQCSSAAALSVSSARTSATRLASARTSSSASARPSPRWTSQASVSEYALFTAMARLAHKLLRVLASSVRHHHRYQAAASGGSDHGGWSRTLSASSASYLGGGQFHEGGTQGATVFHHACRACVRSRGWSTVCWSTFPRSISIWNMRIKRVWTMPAVPQM